MEIPKDLPKLNTKYINDFIAEWNSLYENLGGMSHNNLIVVAKQLKIQQAAMKMLISNHIKIRLTGIITLGNMQHRNAWNILESIARSDQVFLSIAAYRALILINTDKALEELLAILIKRQDWPPSMVVKVLKDINNSKTCSIIAKSCEDATEKQLGNLIQYINTLRCTRASNVIQKILSEEHDDHLKSLCLRDLNDPTAIDLVHEHISSDCWHVKMHAATALGKIGDRDDIRYLVALLSDEHWWVRYRAAQALIKMPFVSSEDLLGIQRKQQCNNAKLILDQVIAEEEWA